MKKKWKTIILCYVLPPFVSAMILSLWFFTVRGIPLSGLPELEDVIRVEITDKRINTTVTIEDKEREMETAVNLPGLLKYSFGKPENEDFIIVITYYLKNGRKTTVEAGRNSVLWDGRVRKIRGDNGSVFLNIVEGYYFGDSYAEVEHGFDEI